MKKVLVVALLLGFMLVISSCSAGNSSPVAVEPTTISSGVPTLAVEQNASINMVRSDSQGAVTVDVEPENLGSPGDKLEFAVSMNTHSVNLNMDLAALATLTTDNGHTAQGIGWDGASGGHHVSGTLSFPTIVNGKSILDGAATLTLTIKDLDAPARIFTWNLIK